MKKPDRPENFWPIASHPNCTHRIVTGFRYEDEDKTPAALWACADCRVRFYPGTRLQAVDNTVKALDALLRLLVKTEPLSVGAIEDIEIALGRKP